MGKITHAQYARAYTVGRAVYHERMSHSDAVSELVEIGMNKASASFSIGNLRQMLNGAAYHRAMSRAQTRYFLTAIEKDDGPAGLDRAVQAFAAHLPYLRKSNGNRMPGLTALLEEFSASSRTLQTDDAIDDFVEKPEGSSAPDRGKRSGTYFKRDPQVRAHVVRRAKGLCEHCGSPGFLMPGGGRFIETHHIIGLAKQGPDTPANVIGLCPNHHREAHFGAGAARLEKLFLAKLAILAY